MSDTGSTPVMDEAALALQKYFNDSQLYYAIAFWAVFYGLYASLFFATCRIMLQKRAVDNFASKVFLICGTMIFLLASIHNFTSLYRLTRGYVDVVTPPGPVYYYFEFTRWDNFSHLVILAVVTWIGDGLVIYRCFLIWKKNYWIVILPILLMVTSMASTFVNWDYFQHPTKYDMAKLQPVFNMVFPLNLAQNVLTTGLIAYKIFMQHRQTRASGLQLSAAVNLIMVVRIIVESAAIYTFTLIIIIILFFLNHPAAVIPQHSLPPAIGVIFALIAVRTHVTRTESSNVRGTGGLPSNSFYPSWMAGHDESGRRQLNVPITVTTVTDQHEDAMALTPVKLRSNSISSQGMDRSDRSFPPEMKV